MRTNIVLDDALVDEAIRVTGIKTKRELVHEALSALIAKYKRRNLSELKGKIKFQDDFDYRQLRENRA